MDLQAEASDGGSLSSGLLGLDHSFGYDSQRLYNLAILDGHVLAHVTGRFLHLYDVHTGSLEYRTSSSSEGISHITAHPTLPHLAVGEKGENPPVVIYKWPHLRELVALRGGAQRGYSFLSYNADGSLLASQGSAPDFLLTLWTWEKGQVLLQAKAFEQEVFSVSFSAFNLDQLATCGVGHLKLWRMSKTFTGLKLQGELGRFGKTETCDLVGALPLPDGTCATGSSWGNVLVWAGGTVRLQVFRVGRLPCHDGAITQLLFHNQSLLSAGMDGAVRVWNLETLEMADPSEDDPLVEMEPLFELFVREGDVSAQLLSLVKAKPDSFDTLWYAQDGGGAVWVVDISTNVTAGVPRRIFWSHAGPVAAAQASPAATLLATLGSDCKLMVFDYVEKSRVMFREFSSPGTCLLWLPLSVAPSGGIMVAGFADGVVRVLGLFSSGVEVIQAVKPHMRDVVSVVLGTNLLVSASSDGTVFVFRLLYKKSQLLLEPLGYCCTQSAATCLAWCPEFSILVGCENGCLLKFQVPQDLNLSENNTYLLNWECESLDCTAMIREEEKKDMLDEDEVEECGQCRIQFLWNSPNGSVWFSVDNDPKSSLFEYDFKEKILLRRVVGLLTAPAVHCSYHLSTENCLFLGLSNGTIQGITLGAGGAMLSELWSCGTHDRDRGAVRQIAASWDGSHLFSCGDDSAIFSYVLCNKKQLHPPPTPPVVTSMEKYSITSDIDGLSALSLEQAKMKSNKDQRLSFANHRKKAVLDSISVLRAEYKTILHDNDHLPVELKVNKTELVPDQRTVDDLNKSLAEEKSLVYRKLARDSERSGILLAKLRGYFLDDVETLTIRVDSIQSHTYVETFRVTKLGDDFGDNMAQVQKRMEEIEAQGRTQIAPEPPEVAPAPRPDSPDPVEGLVKQVAALGNVSRSRKLAALCRQHRSRRAAVAARAAAWQELMRREPDPSRSDPKELLAIELAKEGLGDYKLKTSPDYKVPQHLNVSTVSKYKTLLEVRQRIYRVKKDFNTKVLLLRNRKQDIISKHSTQHQILAKISNEIPESLRVQPPAIAVVNEELEFPEKRFKMTEEDVLRALPTSVRHLREHHTSEKSDVNMTPQSLFSDESKKFFSGDTTGMNILDMQLSAVDENIATAWEGEMHEMRGTEAQEQQNYNVSIMMRDIVQFDEQVIQLSEEKIQLDVDLKFLELHLLTLHQEILVLKTFEKEESLKSNVAFELLKEKRHLKTSMNEITAEMEKKVLEIRTLEDEVKLLVSTFLTTIAENKYYEFLKKIFKKKYKPPKVKTDDSDESCSSESETDSDDEEDKSLDSKEFSVVKLNETICPEGCDRDLYERTFEKRTARYDLELIIADKRKEIEALKKTYDGFGKRVSKVDQDYGKAQRDLENLQREKQLQLNKIETVVVIRLSQFQNFSSDDSLEPMEKSLVLSSNLLTHLYSRIGELTRETSHQKSRHEQNKIHLQRLAVDIRFMTQLVAQLEQEIEEAVLRKFGAKVDLDELEEALVKKLVAEMNFIPFELQQKLDKKLVVLQRKLEERVDMYTGRLVENTKRYNILTLLKDEQNKLEEALTRQEMKKAEPPRGVDPCDLERLSTLVKTEELTVARLREEIACLRQKTRPLPPPGEFGPLPRETRQTALMRCPDGSYQEIALSVRDNVQDMAADAEELIADLRADFGVEQAAKRLKRLVEKFMDIIPEPVLRVMWEKLSEGQDGDLGEMLEDQRVLLASAEMLMQMVASILPPSAGVLAPAKESGIESAEI